jgi:hypothetical protein
MMKFFTQIAIVKKISEKPLITILNNDDNLIAPRKGESIIFNKDTYKVNDVVHLIKENEEYGNHIVYVVVE